MQVHVDQTHPNGLRRFCIGLAVGTAILLIALGTAGCGASGNSNTGRIASAETAASTMRIIESELAKKLETYETSVSASPWFRAGPGECSIDGIYTGSEAELYAEESDALASPDGSAVIETVPVHELEGASSSQADCLNAVQMAMGWDK
jgi:hypothetical protein